ncbi:hypothetical protein DES45_11717 [Microvirga subterranea]|uniref:Uncharacterized protein n=1 Tax=Microvirga subterranea TaxID=186651 RepID=A0A370HAB5_9HYPH|nr:hypothetical protein DES45_11717 [Microvirga subterranea]
MRLCKPEEDVDNPYRNSDDGKCLVSEIEPGWTLEYYFVDHIMWVRETRNGRSLEQPIGDALCQDPFERATYFGGIAF